MPSKTMSLWTKSFFNLIAGGWLANCAAILMLVPPRINAQTVLVQDQFGEAMAQVLVTVATESISAIQVPNVTHNMDQVGKRFVPNVMAIRSGDSIIFPNSDDIRHHVYSFSVPKTFEIPLYSGEPAEPITFFEAGLVVVGCNIHDRMQGYIYIIEGKEYGLTKEDGTVTFTNLPNEELTLTISHHEAVVNNSAYRISLKELKNRQAPFIITMKSSEQLNNNAELSPLERKFMELRQQGH